MPIYWTIDSKLRLVTVKAEGEVSLDSATELLEAIAGASALSYRKVFDGHTATSVMSAYELLALCGKIRSYHGQAPMGALAVVATPAQTWLFARLLGTLATAKRPMKVFADYRQARRWIDELPNALGRERMDKQPVATLNTEKVPAA